MALVVGFLLLASLMIGSAGGRAVADTRPVDPNDPKTPVTVSDDALPTPQINGVVWSTVIVNNVVYAGGSFTNARPAGAAAGVNTSPRSNLMAFDLTTGALLSYTATFNGQIRSLAVSPDRTRLYAGGEFTTVNGSTRQRLAAFSVNPTTGALGALTTFAPAINSRVAAVVATNSTVYAGGDFSGVGNQTRGRLAAFNTAGGLLTWAPTAAGGGGVAALTINPQGTKVAIGGGFLTLNGSDNPGYGLGMVDATTGANLPMAINSIVRNGTVDGAIDTLTTDGTYIYGGGWTFGRVGGTMEGVFAASWDGGEVRFINDCHGDTYGGRR